MIVYILKEDYGMFVRITFFCEYVLKIKIPVLSCIFMNKDWIVTLK